MFQLNGDSLVRAVDFLEEPEKPCSLVSFHFAFQPKGLLLKLMRMNMNFATPWDNVEISIIMYILGNYIVCSYNY